MLPKVNSIYVMFVQLEYKDPLVHSSMNLFVYICFKDNTADKYSGPFIEKEKKKRKKNVSLALAILSVLKWTQLTILLYRHKISRNLFCPKIYPT